MIPEAEALRDALCSVYRPWVTHVIGSRGWGESPGLAASLDDGAHWLGSALDELLVEPFERQRRGPLEVFQEAMRFPTVALTGAGRDPIGRDASVVNALPGDIYDLAPASSAQLGEEVWHAHVRWGAAKAATFVTPSPDEP